MNGEVIQQYSSDCMVIESVQRSSPSSNTTYYIGTGRKTLKEIQGIEEPNKGADFDGFQRHMAALLAEEGMHRAGRV